ncbi:MAG TPA: nucleotidyltransferase, partial [Leptospiraceae bacterium]|nr:nucleotidyltransferase [Leptospiraceae bacterium]
MELFTVFAVIFFIILALGINVEQEYTRGIVFRLGKFSSVKGPGIYWIIPFVDRRVRVDIRTNTVDVESQETVTGDSVTIKINAVLFYKVIHPEKAIIDVADFRSAIYQSALTAMRNVIGQHVLDQV